MGDMQETLVALFTEVAILEQLVRVREERYALHDLSMGEFATLNYFMLNHPMPDSVVSIAFCFQEEESYTRAKVDGLAARGLVTITPPIGNGEPMVMITEAGREKRDEIVAKLAPEIQLAVAEVPREDLETTLATLRNIRFTLDNLPDR